MKYAICLQFLTSEILQKFREFCHIICIHPFIPSLFMYKHCVKPLELIVATSQVISIHSNVVLWSHPPSKEKQGPFHLERLLSSSCVSSSATGRTKYILAIVA